ncbi:hypothetical protein AAVH_27451 [Aphelenchoides avenae]|nr:hypothetical protein AAVH_27451 [Aphelenchus avenae]
MKIKPTPKRKRACLESDDEPTSSGSACKPSQTTDLRIIKLEEDSATLRKKSASSSKYTPLIILGANSNTVRARSNASSPEIPIIFLE